jgi:transcriptional regulator with XRE-family HTH domain
MSASSPRGAWDLRDGQTVFSTRLRQEREKAGISTFEMARRCCADRADFEAWEDGTKVPTRLEFKRLIGSLRRMRFFPPDFTLLRRDEVVPPATLMAAAGLASAGEAAYEPDPASAVEPLPLPPEQVADPPATFGVALRRERELEDVDQETVADILGVSGQAVSFWENEVNCPVKENFDKLLALFPRLRHAPEPDWRDIPVPVGGGGRPRLVEAEDPATVGDMLNQDLASVPRSPLDFEGRMLAAARMLRALDPTGLDPRLHFSTNISGVWRCDAGHFRGSGRTPGDALTDAIAGAASDLQARRQKLLAEAQALDELVKSIPRAG